MSCCHDDDTFGTEARRKALDVLEREKKDWQMQLFPKVKHGFACRGNMEVPYERKFFLQRPRIYPDCQLPSTQSWEIIADAVSR